MARIRTIKPDFWTSEPLSECSLSARLLFIGTWTFADDNGNLDRSAKRLKMQIFPADSLEVEPLIQELITHGLLIEYSVSEEKYLHIPGFNEHQVINRPSKSSRPEYEKSHNTHGTLSEDSRTEGKGREGKGKEGKKNVGEKSPPRFSEDDLAIAKEIFSGILELNPKHKQPSMDKWAEIVRLMRERDGKTSAEIRAMWVWAHNHDFWAKNILGPDKLRLQWDKLVIQRKERPRSGDPFAGCI